MYQKLGENIYSLVLYKLIGIELLPEEAKDRWHGIIRHRTHMRMLLKREVKLEVAALDYFTSITDFIESAVIVDEKFIKKLQKSVMIDELTGLYNYRYYEKRIDEEIAYAKRYNKVFSIVLFDIDNFKSYNDKCGHLAGNRLLKELAKIVKENSRKSDIPIRFGGDEFLILLPDTNKRGALIFAEKIRTIIADRDIKPKVTVSGGVGTFPTDTAKDSKELFKLIDKALYRAKAEGKNRVVAYPVERREYKRISMTDKEAKFKIITPERLNGKEPRIRDISIGGISFYIDKKIAPSEYIEAIIPSKLGKIKFTGRVVWCSKLDDALFEVGVKFISITRENLKIIKGLK